MDEKAFVAPHINQQRLHHENCSREACFKVDISEFHDCLYADECMSFWNGCTLEEFFDFKEVLDHRRVPLATIEKPLLVCWLG